MKQLKVRAAFGRRERVLMELSGKPSLEIFQKTSMLFSYRDGDLIPHSLFNKYVKTLSDSDRVRIYEIHKAFLGKKEKEFINPPELFEFYDIVKFENLKQWLSKFITIPTLFSEMDKSEYGKDPILTYSGEEYMDLVTLVTHFNMASVLIAYSGLMLDSLTFETLWDNIKGYYKSRNIHIMDKFMGQVSKVINSKTLEKSIEMEISMDEVVDHFAVTALMGRLATHNVVRDNNEINLVKRVHFTLVGKSRSNIKERGLVIGDTVISEYDIQKPYEITSGSCVEYNVLCSHPDTFIRQVYPKGLTPRKKELLDMANDNMVWDKIPEKEVIALLSLAIRDFINPNALRLLKKPKGVDDSINLCRAVGFMETYDTHPEIAKSFISETLISGEYYGNKSKLRQIHINNCDVCQDLARKLLVDITNGVFSHVYKSPLGEFMLGLDAPKLVLNYINDMNK